MDITEKLNELMSKRMKPVTVVRPMFEVRGFLQRMTGTFLKVDTNSTGCYGRVDFEERDVYDVDVDNRRIVLM